MAWITDKKRMGYRVRGEYVPQRANGKKGEGRGAGSKKKLGGQKKGKRGLTADVGAAAETRWKALAKDVVRGGVLCSAGG